MYPFNPQNEDYIEFKYVYVIAAFAIQISFLQVEINGHFGAHIVIGGGGGGDIKKLKIHFFLTTLEGGGIISLSSIYRRMVNIFPAMIGCLAHFAGKGNHLMCESRNKDHVHVLEYVKEYH